MESKETNSLWAKVVQAISSIRTTLRIMRYNRVGYIGFLVLMGLILISYIGPYFIELDNNTKIDQIYQTPSAEHWLGTDDSGKDN